MVTIGVAFGNSWTDSDLQLLIETEHNQTRLIFIQYCNKDNTFSLVHFFTIQDSTRYFYHTAIIIIILMTLNDNNKHWKSFEIILKLDAF